MSKIKDFMNNNGNVMVVVQLTESINEVGICNDRIYKGWLSDIPKELQDYEVVHEGFALSEQFNVLTVLKEAFFIELDKGIDDMENGRVVPHEEAMKNIRERLGML